MEERVALFLFGNEPGASKALRDQSYKGAVRLSDKTACCTIRTFEG